MGKVTDASNRGVAPRVAMGLLAALPWIIAAAAVAYMLVGLRAQAEAQAGLNRSMQGVLANVREAGRLTGETADALSPLAATSATLERMNSLLLATVRDLTAMNGSLDRVVTTQKEMLSGLEVLNGQTREVTGVLGEIDRQNRSLLSATGTLASQTARQAGSLESLTALTAETVGQLRELNRKFTFLR